MNVAVGSEVICSGATFTTKVVLTVVPWSLASTVTVATPESDGAQAVPPCSTATTSRRLEW